MFLRGDFMRIIFISDIHGIVKNLDYIKKRFYDLKCEKIFVLGDLFNGPSRLEYYNPLYVLKFLNNFKDKIICMKGNCDFNYDLEKCDFVIHDGLYKTKIDNRNFYFNHGNLYNYNNLGEINDGILIYGHEHKSYIRKKNNVLCINPGSISLSRGLFDESYLFYNNGKFIIYDINDNVIDEYNLNE